MISISDYTNVLQEDILSSLNVIPFIETYSIDKDTLITNNYTSTYKFRLFIHFKQIYKITPPCYYVFYVNLSNNYYEIYLLEREINNKLVDTILNYLINNNVIYKIDNTTYRLTNITLLEVI